MPHEAWQDMTRQDMTRHDKTIDHHRPDQHRATDNNFLEVQWSPRYQGIAQRPPVGRYDLARSCKAVAGIARTTPRAAILCPKMSRGLKWFNSSIMFNLHLNLSVPMCTVCTIAAHSSKHLRKHENSISTPGIPVVLSTCTLRSRTVVSISSIVSNKRRRPALELIGTTALIYDRHVFAYCWWITPTSTVQAAILIELRLRQKLTI